jgi:hypothetical protein
MTFSGLSERAKLDYEVIENYGQVYIMDVCNMCCLTSLDMMFVCLLATREAQCGPFFTGRPGYVKFI